MGNPQGFWLMGACGDVMVGMLNATDWWSTIWFRPEVATLWWLMVAIVASFAPAVTWTEPATDTDSQG